MIQHYNKAQTHRPDAHRGLDIVSLQVQQVRHLCECVELTDGATTQGCDSGLCGCRAAQVMFIQMMQPPKDVTAVCVVAVLLK